MQTLNRNIEATNTIFTHIIRRLSLAQIPKEFIQAAALSLCKEDLEILAEDKTASKKCSYPLCYTPI